MDTPAPETAPDPDPGCDAADADADAQAALDLDRQDILLLRHLPQILAELRAVEDPADRVRWAIDRAQIAVCERICRLARRDLPADRA